MTDIKLLIFSYCCLCSGLVGGLHKVIWSLLTFGWFSLKLGGRLNPRRMYKYNKISNFSEYLAKRQMDFNLKIQLGIGRGAHIEPIKYNKYVRWRKMG